MPLQPTPSLPQNKKRRHTPSPFLNQKDTDKFERHSPALHSYCVLESIAHSHRRSPTHPARTRALFLLESGSHCCMRHPRHHPPLPYTFRSIHTAALSPCHALPQGLGHPIKSPTLHTTLSHTEHGMP